MKEFLKEIYGRILFAFFRIFPLQDKVVFSSFWGKKYADNPKYISEMLEMLAPEVKQVWLNNSESKFENISSNIKCVKWGTVKMIYEMSTAKVWVDNHTKPCWIRKRKGQLYIETWHGGLGMKKIEADMGKNLKPSSKRQIQYNSSIADLFISNSTWLTQIYKRAFWYNGKILECGYPKNDILFENQKHEQIENKIKKYYKIDKNKKILLYAPTYRGDPNFRYDINLEELYENLNINKEEWIIMYKLHPTLINTRNNLSELVGKIIDVTKYNDIQELIISTNILITDYSSCIFDMAMLHKPAFIYASDMRDYIENRGLYFDIRELPFPFAETNSKLIENIKNFNNEKYQKELKKYFEKVGLKESGNAAKKIADIIIDYIKNKN